MGRLGKTLEEEPKQEWGLTGGSPVCLPGQWGGHREGV